jgi:hypothetical protein
VSFQNIGGEFHAIHICKIFQKASDRSCLSERLPYTGIQNGRNVRPRQSYILSQVGMN